MLRPYASLSLNECKFQSALLCCPFFLSFRELPRPQPPVVPQAPRPRQRPTAEYLLDLQRRRQLQEEQAKEAGLPIPPPATGKGGRGKLIFPQTDSYRFVLHIRDLTQDR